MKIAILTILDNWDNYGSVLQMLALRNWLSMLGNEVYFVKPPRRLDMIRRDILNYIKDYKIDKNMNLYLLRVINKCIRISCYIVSTSVEQILKRIRYKKVFQRISIKSIRDIDLVVLGSDTLWDLDNRTFQDSFYWGEEIIGLGVTIISYAVSCDSLEVLDVNKYPWISECISRFHSISVRDYHTKKLVQLYNFKDISVVCDPTLLCPETLELKKIEIAKRYILIYAFDLNDVEMKCIKEFAQEENLFVICAMGLRKYSFADINVDCGFEGFSSIVRGAAYVYTSTFHGCMFSIIHNKKAVYKAKNNKIVDLLTRFELSNRIFEDDMSSEQFGNIMKQNLNHERLNYIKESYRLESQTFLQKVFDEIQREKNIYD